MLLGPVEILTPDGALTPTAPMLRRVLALLLIRANTVVRSGTLVEELWGDRPPRSARTTLQTYIYQLRKLLNGPRSGGGAAPGADMLLTRPSGYELRLGGAELDVREFEELVDRAKTARAEGLVEDAVEVLRSALDLWSGCALTGVEMGPVLDAAVTRLEELRKEALELRLELELQLGKHHELVSELLSLVSSHPAHEGFVAKLMLALVRSGRRVEALEVYRKTRAELVNGLGLEPSPEIQELHQSILNGDMEVGSRTATLATAMPLPAPAQLPAAIGDFVDRAAEHSYLRTALRGGGSGVQVVQILGSPGVGKTTFALQAAHELRPLFPDGQFYADVGELADPGRGLAATLGGFLRGCGVPPDRLPTRVIDLSSMFRTWTADRRALVVLDDAVSDAHVRALSPGGSSCAMLVAGRTRLTSMPSVITIGLPPLSEAAAVDLLGRLIGRERVKAEPGAARALVRICNCLPLALRALAARLVLRRQWRLAQLVERLTQAEDLIAELGDGGLRLVSTVEASTRQLAVMALEAFHLIGELGVPIVTAELIARRMGIKPVLAEGLLEQLADANLIEEQSSAPDEAGRWHSCYRVSLVLRHAAKRLAENGRMAPGIRLSDMDSALCGGA
ncbi:BTAD domain-containing putative transcriptional regulator [Amycolatopsis sp. cg5]|uniref:AfsR/SARP family transcriptional regulator n=1 Tax=Amycolatopsis sp. cg5 TaxID=3238802 RepID=UPI0035256A30